MFDAHPPFQIDGNFGGAAGIIEMLVQSRIGRLRLLPALPRHWPSGRVSGVRARGGLELAMTWADGELAEATLTALRVGTTRVICGNDECLVDHPPGSTHRIVRLAGGGLAVVAV